MSNYDSGTAKVLKAAQRRYVRSTALTLSGRALEIYDELLPDLAQDARNRTSLALLATQAQALATVEACTKLIDAEGLFPQGKAHPALKVRDEASRLALSVAGRLKTHPLTDDGRPNRRAAARETALEGGRQAPPSTVGFEPFRLPARMS